jgi:transposase
MAELPPGEPAVNSELADAQWAFIQPHLPAPQRSPQAKGRRTINGILYVLRTGRRWQDS